MEGAVSYLWSAHGEAPIQTSPASMPTVGGDYFRGTLRGVPADSRIGKAAEDGWRAAVNVRSKFIAISSF
jgi:hypothetical protein